MHGHLAENRGVIKLLAANSPKEMMGLIFGKAFFYCGTTCLKLKKKKTDDIWALFCQNVKKLNQNFTL